VTLSNLKRRISLAFAVLTGRVPLPPTVINNLELDMALEQLKALVSTGQAAADRLIAKAGSDAAALADAQAQIANFEADAAAAVQPLVDQLTSAAPESPSAAGTDVAGA
jgi:hypothetical protein